MSDDPLALPELEERPVPLWQKITAVAYVAIAVTLLVVFRDRLGADFWPFDKSRVAPNILATIIQILLWAPVVVLVWPPTRRRIHHWMTCHTAPLHAQLARLHEQREQHHVEQMRKLDEIHDHLKHKHPLP